MEHNDNNNKDLKQGDHLQPLPPALAWDNMKDGILDKMNVIEQAELPQADGRNSRKRTWLFLSLFIAIAFVSAVGLMFLLPEETTDQTGQSSAKVQIPIPAPEASGNTPAAINPPEPTGHQGISEEMTAETDGSDHTHDLQPASMESAFDQAPEETRLLRREKAAMSDTQGQIANRIPTSLPESAQNALSPHTAEPVDSSVRSLIALPAIFTRIQVPVYRQLLPSLGNQQIAHLAHQAPAASEKIDSASIPLLPHTQPVNLLVLEGGVNLWTEGYGNSLSDREQYETPIPSFQLQGSYMKGLKGGYFILAGVQYQQLESRFDFSSTIEDYPITLEDTIVEIRKNPLTGEETLIRGDVVQTVRAERIVRHFNKTQLFKTSLAIGKNWRFNAFQTDVYLGGALNGIVRNQGRMFFDGDIIDYTGASTPAFQNRWTVDGVAGVRLHYFPVDRIGISTGIQAQRSLMNWSTEEGVRLYPLSVGLQVGVSYRL